MIKYVFFDFAGTLNTFDSTDLWLVVNTIKNADPKIELGIISHSKRERIEKFLKKHNQFEAFEGKIFVPGPTGVRKENGQLFRLAQDLCNVEDDEAIMVGDSITKDVVPAGNMPWFVVWYTPEGKELKGIVVRKLMFMAFPNWRKIFFEEGRSYYATNPKELAKVLKKIILDNQKNG